MEVIGERKRDNGREGRIIYIDLICEAHLSFISLPMMPHFLYSSLLLLFIFILNEAKKPGDPLQGRLTKLPHASSTSLLPLGTHAVCADVCTSTDAHVELDLSEPRIYRENERVRIDLHHTGSGRCREPGILFFHHRLFLYVHGTA